MPLSLHSGYHDKPGTYNAGVAAGLLQILEKSLNLLGKGQVLRAGQRPLLGGIKALPGAIAKWDKASGWQVADCLKRLRQTQAA